MKRKNATRNALFTSILALLLCVSMLVGTTLAWFTDEVTSGINTIQSGNLDVVLEYKTNWDSDWAPVTSETKVFKDGALYEPGYTEVVFLRVSNAGSLALKYNLTVNVAAETGSTNVKDEEFLLSEHLQVGSYIQDEIVDGANYADVLIPVMFGSRETALSNVTLGKLSDFDGSLANASPLLPGEETAQVVALVLTMPETVGNEANHKTGVEAPSIQLGVNLIAAQLTHEEDSFGNDYDKIALVNNAEELVAAVAEGGAVTLLADIELDQTVTIPADKAVTLNLNGHKIVHTGAGTNLPIALTNQGDLTVDGDGIISGAYAGLYSNGNLTVNGGTFQSESGFGLLVDNIYGTEASVATINGGTFAGVGVYNPAVVTVNGGTFNVGRDPDGATDHLSEEMTLFVSPTFTGAPNTATVTLNGGTFNGDVYVYDDGITETVFVNNGATITGDVLDNA